MHMDMEDFFEIHYWEMILRSTLSFVVLLILARLMGKKQISQLTFFHYATGITIGSIAAEIAGQHETPFMDGLIAMIWWALLTLITSFISFKSKKARIVLNDKPTIVLREGKLLEGSLRKLRLDVNDLKMMLREQSIFSIKDVHYAVLETNGKLSVLKKVGQEAATKQDVKAPVTEPKYIPSVIIQDGQIVQRNLPELDLTEEWVFDQLKKHGIGKVEHVFYAEIQTDGSLHVDMMVPKKE